MFSKNSIVSPKRRKEIIGDCTKEQTYFICHKASIENKDIACKSFYDQLGHVSQLIRIAERLNMIEFVDQPPDKEKLTSYHEQKQITKNI